MAAEKTRANISREITEADQPCRSIAAPASCELFAFQTVNRWRYSGSLTRKPDSHVSYHQTRSQEYHECIKAFSETDFTDDLTKFDIPTLVVQTNDNQGVPIDAAGQASAKIIKPCEVDRVSGRSSRHHRSHKDQLNANLLAFTQD